MPSRNQRLAFGVFLLLIVDIIWVLSNELTKFLYQNEDFNKPFFCTYFKTSLFGLYLVAMGIMAPWRKNISVQQQSNEFPEPPSNNNYALINDDHERLVDSTDLDHNSIGNDGDDTAIDDDGDVAVAATAAAGNSSHSADKFIRTNRPDSIRYNGNYSRLSDSIFVPIKAAGSVEELNQAEAAPKKRKRTLSASSSSSEEDTSTRSVRFNDMAEVRELSPLEATEALMSRLSYSASVRMHRQKSHHRTARIALMFAVLWFLANYLYQLALGPSEAALVTVLSSTSNLFTLILAAIFPSAAGDRFTLSKCVAVFISIGGVVLISWSEIDDTADKKMGRGIAMAIMSAFLYACYLVLVKRKSETEQKIDIPLFFGFVGLWNFLIMWPLFLVLNFSHIEEFAWPNRRQFLILLLNGVLGTVISEALWLWGCFLTSSLVGTLAITLQIPLAMLMDVLIRGKVYPLMFYLGSIPILVAILFVALLLNYDDSDPVLRLLKVSYRKMFKLRWRQQMLRAQTELDDEQHECLINGRSHNDIDESSVTIAR